MYYYNNYCPVYKKCSGKNFGYTLCYHDGLPYSEGSLICSNGSYQICENGNWEPAGLGSCSELTTKHPYYMPQSPCSPTDAPKNPPTNKPSSCPPKLELPKYKNTWIYIWPNNGIQPFWLYLQDARYDGQEYKILGCAYLCPFPGCYYSPFYEFNVNDIDCYGI